MTGQEGFLLRSPLVGKDSNFRGYLFATTSDTAVPYRQLFAAIEARRSPGGICLIEDNGAAFDEVSEEVPDSVIVCLTEARANCIAPLRQRRVGSCARLTGAMQDLPPALAAADFVWLDLSQGESVRTVARAAQRLPGQRIAGGIASRAQFEDAKDLGIKLFEGNWYREVTGPGPKQITPGQAAVLELIDLTRREAPVGQIEQVLKRDATLSFRLLRYINSAGFGLSCEIQSFRHAVSILGYQNLSRWLALLLATSGTTAAAPVLMREAAVRGRLTELIGESFMAREERDNLFIVGVFSLLPAILQMPIERLLDQLNLPETVNDALLTRSGLYGPIVRLAESVEAKESATLAKAAADMQLSVAQVNRLHLEALAWANQLTA
ncbi:MAG: HDOD domain-containing protein [Betaproteobacteria bacterium]|jgi:EAL and modified HD-GYP domain-containing signal transduction protein